MADNERILLIIPEMDVLQMIEQKILKPEGYQIVSASNGKSAEQLTQVAFPDLVIMSDSLEDVGFMNLAQRLVKSQPTLPIIILSSQDTVECPIEALHLGIHDWIKTPIESETLAESVRQGLKRRKDWKDWFRLEARRYTGPLLQRVDELEALAKIGQKVTAQLDLDGVLSTVVDSAVDITNAEEGSIMLLDDESGELYMRAARNFNDDFVHTFRLPVKDSLAGEVLRTGKPKMVQGHKPQKIKTAYLVQSVIYVPLKIHGKTIGVLSVDNQQSGNAFEEQHLTLLSAMADYAAVAIENAQLYSQSEIEKNKLEQILTQIKDGVIILDNHDRIILVNQAVRTAFGLGEVELTGKLVAEVFSEDSLLEASKGETDPFFHIEIIVDSQVFDVQVTSILDVGKVITLHDITYLKELDRVKTEFVNTVSHDLRSPLTAILGYVELIERVGEVNETQSEFIRRVQFSVNSITMLITNLLDLGKIEVGLGEKVENVRISPILRYAVDGIRPVTEEREQKVFTRYPEDLPAVNGSPKQLRLMVDNLLKNASQYTPIGGELGVVGKVEDGQLIIQVLDKGIGIPLEEQNKIFEKFVRGTNIGEEVPGTGLGLAIVKSIVENHNGRIWVESKEGKGSVFTIVLPEAETPQE